MQQMSAKQAQELLKSSIGKVDWHNFITVIFALSHHPWGGFQNDRWIPDYNKAWLDHYWLETNMPAIFQAIKTMKKQGKKPLDSEPEA